MLAAMTFCTGNVFAASADPFSDASALLAAGDLAGAQQAYESMITSGVRDADVYYNLGNVLFRQERLPEAVVAWRRAALLAPRDADVAANLEFARRKFVDAIPPVEPAPVWAPWQAALTADEGQWIGGVLAGIGLLVVANRRRFGAAPAAGIGAFTTVVGLVLGAGGAAESTLSPAAVVLPREATVRSDLGAGVDLFVLHAGAEVVTGGSVGEFVLVALPDGRKGWLPAASIGLVDLEAPMPSTPLVGAQPQGSQAGSLPTPVVVPPPVLLPSAVPPG